MSDPQVPSPYDDDDLDVLLGSRVAIQSTPLDWFKTNTNETPGNDRQVPYEDELAHDPETGAIWVLTRDEEGNVVPKSHSMSIYNRIREMEDSGIFDNAMAFIFNKEIYRLYFDADRLTVKACSDIVFDDSHRYYAIRSAEQVAGGSYRYYTGIRANDGSGTIITNLVDMDRKEGPEGAYRVFSTGGLLEPMNHGKNYIVEFYDEDRLIIRHLVFQAVSVRYMTIDMTPDTAVAGLRVVSDNMHHSGANAVYLRQGQGFDDLNIKVYLEYSDGHLRDVTHELGSKLHIEGLEDLTTDELTGENEDGSTIVPPQTFVVSYQLSQASVIDSEYFNADTLTITKTIEVYVLQDISDVPRYVVPIMRKIQNNFVYNTELKFFALYEVGLNRNQGVMRDITQLVRNNQFANFTYNALKNMFIGNEASTSNDNHITLVVPLGNNRNKEFEFNIKLLYPQGIENTQAIYQDINEGTPFKSLYYMRWTQGVTNSFRMWNYQAYNIHGGAVGAPVNISQQYLKDTFAFAMTDGSNPITPTHFTVRHGLYPNHVYARNVNINNIDQAFDVIVREHYDIIDQLPLIIEFNRLTYEEGSDIIVNSMCTGICSFIVRS